MSSILTNTGAMVALQSLKSINKGLAQTQSQISTGKNINTAKDNAAVWAISKVMESDVGSFKKLSEGLSVASSTVAVARDATETVTDLLMQMKEKAVQAASATTTDGDRTKIEADVQALREQIGTVVGSAQFNGINLINGKQPTPFSVLSSLDRSGTGDVTTSEIDVDVADLTENNVTTAAVTTGTTEVTTVDIGTINGAVAGTAASTAVNGTTKLAIAKAGEGIVYTAQIGTDDALTYVANKEDSTDDVARKLNEQLQATYAGNDDYKITLDGSEISITNKTAAAVNIELSTFTGGKPADARGLGALSTLHVETAAQAATALNTIDDMISFAVSTAAKFGTAQKQIETQNEFVSRLTDSMKTGIGALVDADMEETSARLQALQTQQQLGIQSLSIANQAPQSVLSLFR